MNLASIIVKPPLIAGLVAGATLAIARPAVGAAPNLQQDFLCTIGGAFVGEIIGAGAPLLLASLSDSNDPSRFASLGLVAAVAGSAGIAIGATVGAVISIALSVFGK